MIDSNTLAERVFGAVDSMDVKALRPFLTPDCRFRFANMPEVRGIDESEDAFLKFYAFLSSISHQIHDVWATADGHVISRVTVTYCRRDGFTITCPAVSIWKLQGKLIQEYEVYVDNSPLFV